MKVDSRYDASSTARRYQTEAFFASGDFQGVLAQAGSPAASGGSTPDDKKMLTAEEKSAKAKAENETARQYLVDYLNRSPMEHMREAILKELGLTEDELNALPPEKRMAMEDEIGRRMREKILGKKDESGEVKDPALAGVQALKGGDSVGGGGAVVAATSRARQGLIVRPNI